MYVSRPVINNFDPSPAQLVLEALFTYHIDLFDRLLFQILPRDVGWSVDVGEGDVEVGTPEGLELLLDKGFAEARGVVGDQEDLLRGREGLDVAEGVEGTGYFWVAMPEDAITVKEEVVVGVYEGS